MDSVERRTLGVVLCSCSWAPSTGVPLSFHLLVNTLAGDSRSFDVASVVYGQLTELLCANWFVRKFILFQAII